MLFLYMEIQRNPGIYTRKEKPLDHKEMTEEILPVVNKQGEQISRASRKECHADPCLLHPVVHLHLIHPDGKLFVQQRSLSKDLYPGYWDTAVGGHISDGETVNKALAREGKEELGIDTTGAVFLFHYIWNNVNESEYVYAYRLVYSGPIILNQDEIMDGKFFSPGEIRELIRTQRTTRNFAHEFRLLEEKGQINCT
jgi:isopentenyldiphosphate isomerase